MLTVADLVVQFQTKLDPVFKGIEKLSGKLDELSGKDIQINVKIDDATKQDIKAISDDLNRIGDTVEAVSRTFTRAFDVVDGVVGNAAAQMETLLQGLEEKLPKAIKKTGAQAHLFMDRFTNTSTPRLLANLSGIGTALVFLISQGFNLKRAFGTSVAGLQFGFQDLLKSMKGVGGLLTSGGIIAGLKSIAITALKMTPQLVSWVSIGGLLLSIMTRGIGTLERFLGKAKAGMMKRTLKVIDTATKGLTALNFQTQLFIGKVQVVGAGAIFLGSWLGKITFGLGTIGSTLLPIFAGFATFGALFRLLSTKIGKQILVWKAGAGDGASQLKLIILSLRDMFPVIVALAKLAKPIAKAITQVGKGKLPSSLQKVKDSFDQMALSLKGLEQSMTKLVRLLAGDLPAAIGKADGAMKASVFGGQGGGRGPPGEGGFLKRILPLDKLKNIGPVLGKALKTSLRGLSEVALLSTKEIAKFFGGAFVDGFKQGTDGAVKAAAVAVKKVYEDTTIFWKSYGKVFFLDPAVKIYSKLVAKIPVGLKEAFAQTGNAIGAVANTALAVGFGLFGKSGKVKAALNRAADHLVKTGLPEFAQRITRALGTLIPTAFKVALGGIKAVAGFGKALFQKMMGGKGDFSGAAGKFLMPLRTGIDTFKSTINQPMQKRKGPLFDITDEKKKEAKATQENTKATEQETKAKAKNLSPLQKVREAMVAVATTATKAATGLDKMATAVGKGGGQAIDPAVLKKMIGGLASLGGGASADPLSDVLGGSRTARGKLDKGSFKQAEIWEKMIAAAQKGAGPLKLLDQLFDDLDDNTQLIKFMQDAGKAMDQFGKSIVPNATAMKKIIKALGPAAPAFFKVTVALQSLADVTKGGDLFKGMFKGIDELNKGGKKIGTKLADVFAQGLREVAKDPKIAQSSATAAAHIMGKIKEFAKAEGLNLGDIFSAKGKSSKAVEASLGKRLESIIGLRGATGAKISKGAEKLVKSIGSSFSKMPGEIKKKIAAGGGFMDVIKKIVGPFSKHLKFSSAPVGLLGNVIRSFSLMGSTIAAHMLKGIGGLKTGLRQYIQEGFGGAFQLVTDLMIAPVQLGLNAISIGIKGLGKVLGAPITAVKKVTGVLLSLIPIVGPALAGLSDMIFGVFETIFNTIFSFLAFIPNAISGMLGKVGKGVGKVANMIFKLVKETSAELYTLALDIQRLGVDTEQFDAMRRAFRFFGVEATETAQAIQFLNQNLANAARGGSEVQATLALAGLTMQDVRDMDPSQVFVRISSAIQDVGQHSAVANRLLELVGASFSNLRTVLVSGPDALIAALDKVKKGGFLLTDKDLKAARDTQHFMQQINQKITDLKTILLTEISPIIDKVIAFWDDYGPSYILKIQAAVMALARTILAIVTEIAMFVKSRYFNDNALKNFQKDMVDLKNFLIGVAKVLFNTVFKFAVRKLRDGMRLVWKAIKSLKPGKFFIAFLKTFKEINLTKTFMAAGSYIMGWTVKGMAQATPRMFGELVKFIGNFVIDKFVPDVLVKTTQKQFSKWIGKITDKIAEDTTGSLIGGFIADIAGNELADEFDALAARINKSLDDVPFEDFGEAFEAASKGLDDEIEKLKKDNEVLGKMFERLKAIGADLPKEYELAMERIQARLTDTTAALEEMKKELVGTKKVILGFSDLLPLLTEFQDKQNNLLGNLGEYVEKLDPILVANKEWREGTISLLNVFNEVKNQGPGLSDMFQQIYSAAGGDKAQGKQLQENLEKILKFGTKAVNAIGAGDYGKAETYISALHEALSLFNKDVAKDFPELLGKLMEFQSFLTPSFWEATKIQMSGLTLQIKILEKNIESAEHHADKLGITLLGSGSNAALFDADLKLLNAQLNILKRKTAKEAEAAILAFGRVFGFQFDANIATKDQIDALKKFIKILSDLGATASAAEQRLDIFGKFEDELSELFGGNLADAFNEAALVAARLDDQLIKTLATVEELALQNGGKIPAGVLKWLNIAEDVDDVYAEIKKRSKEISADLAKIAAMDAFVEAFTKLDDILSRGVDSNPFNSFINLQGQAERSTMRLRVELEAAKLATELWFKTLSKGDPERFFDAVGAAYHSGVLKLPIGFDIEGSSIEEVMEVLGKAMQDSINQALDNEALKALRERIRANITAPLTQSVGTILRGLADGSITEAARSAREAAKAIGQEFSTTLFYISKLGEEIFNNYLDKFLGTLTELIEDGLTTAITSALSSGAVGDALSSFGEAVQKGVGAAITGLLAVLGLILSRLQSEGEAVNDQINSVVNSTEAIRGVISGDTTIAIKETEDAFRASMEPVVGRLDIIIRLMMQGRGFGSSSSPLAGPTLTAI